MKVPITFYSHITKQQTTPQWELPDPPPGKPKLNTKGLTIYVEMFQPPIGSNFNVFFISVSDKSGYWADAAISNEQARTRLARLIQNRKV